MGKRVAAMRAQGVLVALGLMIAGASVHAQPAPDRLNLVPSTAEEIGRVPNHLVWLRPQLQMVQDPLDGALVFIDDDGRVAGRAALPADFDIGAVVVEAEQVRLIDTSDRRQVIVERNVDPAAVPALRSVALPPSALPRAQFARRDAGQISVEMRHRTGTSRFTVRSVTGGTLAQVYEIGDTASPDRFVVTEEIVSSGPELVVRAFVQRFDRDGRLVGLAHIPLDGMDVVPRDFITVTDTGAVRVLVPSAGGVRIREIALSPPRALPAPGSGAPGEQAWRSLGTSTREILVDSNIITPRGSGDLEPPRRRFVVKAPTPRITRERVIANARAYLAVNWTMQRDNYAKPGIENICDPPTGRFWLRPTRFTRASIGKTFGPMPYRWGGDDSPEGFRLRINWGALAGDICTCREALFDFCLVPDAAGVDCSGFVSQAWGIPKRGTAGLMDVAHELGSLGEMRPGDAFNRPGRHIRLFVRPAEGALMAFTVLESATRRDCEGVCERTYRPSELHGYRLIRYRGIID
jgi:hypothetical protein